MSDDFAERRARWEKAGKPLFSKLWTYEEIKAMENNPKIKKKGKKKLPNAHLETPEEWPEDTKIDPGTWVAWLPEGWKQGKRTQEQSGKILTCYFDKNNKRYWHRRDIEKALGKKLVEKPRGEVNEEEPKTEEAKNSFITDDDVWPSWPGDWLPKDWRICFRQLPGNPHKIYVPPNQEEGFCYHRSTVEKYIKSDGMQNLTPFGTSKFAEQRSVVSRKRKAIDSGLARRYKYAKADDYEEVKAFTVFKLPLTEKQKKTCGVESLADYQEIHAELLRNQFQSPMMLLTSLTKTKKAKEPIPQPQVVEKMCCLWQRRADDFCGKPCFQKIFLKLTGPIGSKKVLMCSDLHIFWSKEYDCWKIGTLNEDLAGYLKCEDNAEVPWETKKTWQVVKSHLCLP